jgi:hypothetical protein
MLIRRIHGLVHQTPVIGHGRANESFYKVPDSGGTGREESEICSLEQDPLVRAQGSLHGRQLWLTGLDHCGSLLIESCCCAPVLMCNCVLR